MAASGRSNLVDDKLIARCRQGESSARQELFSATIEDVRRIVFRLAGPGQDFEDLVQQVYLALFASLGRFRAEARFSTWLFAICLGVVRKRARGLGRLARLRQRLQQHVEPPERPGDDATGRLDARLRVWKVLRRLSARHREVLVMYEMEGLSGAEIAELLNVPRGTVWTRLHHARRAFRRLYGER